MRFATLETVRRPRMVDGAPMMGIETGEAPEGPDQTIMVGGAETLPAEEDSQALLDHLVRLSPGTYDPAATHLLAAASTWVYSDLDTFRRMINRRGIGGAQFAELSFRNDALFLEPAAYMIQSADGRLGILCFRGTQVLNIINWLTDVSAKPDPFMAIGPVHGGFNRAVRVIWPQIKSLLLAMDCRKPVSRVNPDRPITEICDPATTPPQLTHGLQALYITGHSLGGSMAVLAAALIHADNELMHLRKKIRGIYTFGQPMVGWKSFAKKANADFGRKLFRHVYRSDVMPALPPTTMGEFSHFGQEYESTETGWMYREGAVQPAGIGSVALAIAIRNFVEEQLPGIREAPFVRRLGALRELLFGPRRRMRWSMADHSPLNYLRTSQMVLPGSEFE